MGNPTNLISLKLYNAMKKDVIQPSLLQLIFKTEVCEDKYLMKKM